MSKNDERRVALVTGGARGIGEAISRTLASRGYDVAINHSSEHSAERARNLAAELSASFDVKAQSFCADVSDFVAAEKLIADVFEQFGRIDALVNNAGITRDALLTRMTEEQFDQVIDVNLKGTFNVLRHAAPRLAKQRSGAVVNLASVVAFYGNVGQANYCASKAGVIGLTKSAAKELARRGVRVNAVAPGFIETDMTDAMPERAREAVLEHIALKKYGEPEDVADAVAFLVSDEARYITGQTLSIDGGMSL